MGKVAPNPWVDSYTSPNYSSGLRHLGLGAGVFVHKTMPGEVYGRCKGYELSTV